MVALIGGETARFAPFAGLFHRALADFGQPERPVGVHSPGHIAASDDQAIEEFPTTKPRSLKPPGCVRGFRPPTMQNFLRDDTVARKITETLRTLGASRFDMKYGMPEIPQTKIMTSIELFGSLVAPLVGDMMAQTPEQRTVPGS